MSEDQDQERGEVVARRLMRLGCDDEVIAARTGLSMMIILALRAGAAVEAPPPRRTTSNSAPEATG